MFMDFSRKSDNWFEIRNCEAQRPTEVYLSILETEAG